MLSTDHLMSYSSPPHFLTAHEQLIMESFTTHDRLQRYTQAIGSTHNFRQVRRVPYDHTIGLVHDV